VLADKLGERYEVMRTNIKKWSVGSPIQAALDALELMLQRRPFAPGEVRKVVVRLGTRSASVVNNRDIPDICLQHMVAVMLIDRTVSFDAAHDVARMRDAAVLRERAKVELVGDAELEARAPRREAAPATTRCGARRSSPSAEISSRRCWGRRNAPR
jgi:2-methylcitrate dehydratase PrpD